MPPGGRRHHLVRRGGQRPPDQQPRPRQARGAGRGPRRPGLPLRPLPVAVRRRRPDRDQPDGHGARPGAPEPGVWPDVVLGDLVPRVSGAHALQHLDEAPDQVGGPGLHVLVGLLEQRAGLRVDPHVQLPGDGGLWRARAARLPAPPRVARAQHGRAPQHRRPARHAGQVAPGARQRGEALRPRPRQGRAASVLRPGQHESAMSRPTTASSTGTRPENVVRETSNETSQVHLHVEEPLLSPGMSVPASRRRRRWRPSASIALNICCSNLFFFK
ncbi:hypothetical protein FOCC_FOCC003517, partial [Frankliniella occidentalis]